MNHLSGMDAMFRHLESAEMPMHIGGLRVLKLPSGQGGDFFEEVKACVAQRLHLAVVFNRKLANIPFDLSNPVWVDDEDIDLDVRHFTLPKPGSNRLLQLHRRAAPRHGGASRCCVLNGYVSLWGPASRLAHGAHGFRTSPMSPCLGVCESVAGLPGCRVAGLHWEAGMQVHEGESRVGDVLTLNLLNGHAGRAFDAASVDAGSFTTSISLGVRMRSMTEQDRISPISISTPRCGMLKGLLCFAKI